MSKTVRTASKLKPAGKMKGKPTTKEYSYKIKGGASMKSQILKGKRPGTSLNDYSLDLMQLD
jgi:hypothetical protein